MVSQVKKNIIRKFAGLEIEVTGGFIDMEMIKFFIIKVERNGKIYYMKKRTCSGFVCVLIITLYDTINIRYPLDHFFF